MALVTYFFWHKNVGNTGTALEQRAPVQPDNESSNSDPQQIVQGLRIGKYGIHHLEVEQDGDQQTAPGNVEQRCQDNGNRDNAK